MTPGQLQVSIRPYQYIRHCLLGKWKMTLLHLIYSCGSIRFNDTMKALQVSEKVLSEQLKDLVEDGLVYRKQYETIPVRVEYALTQAGESLVPLLDELCTWSIRRIDELNRPIAANIKENPNLS